MFSSNLSGIVTWGLVRAFKVEVTSHITCKDRFGICMSIV